MDCPYLPKVRDAVARLALAALEEDLPEGDVTAEVLGLRERHAKAQVICREPVTVCGAGWYDLLPAAYRSQRPESALILTCLVGDGETVPAGTVLFEWEGDVASIVGLERIFLNFLGRATGIATQTRAFVEAVRDQGIAILDTRKTLPGYRYFDKYAVLCGGGRNHRFSLSDQVLIKENHVARLGGVAAALRHVRERLPQDTIIQVEVRNLQELAEALQCQCPLILLDNFTPKMVSRACAMERGNSQLEVSGGITLANIAEYRFENLDRISIGALTHSVKAPDLSLLLSEE